MVEPYPTQLSPELLSAVLEIAGPFAMPDTAEAAEQLAERMHDLAFDLADQLDVWAREWARIAERARAVRPRLCDCGCSRPVAMSRTGRPPRWFADACRKRWERAQLAA